VVLRGQDSVSASSDTAVRGSSSASTAQSANAPIAYGAVCTIEAANECPLRYPKNTVPNTATPTAPPSCCAVPNNPDAPPAASTGTAASTAAPAAPRPARR
jgi:hypothetical protein